MIDIFSSLIHGVLSKPVKKGREEKISIARLEIKGKKVFQFTILENNKALHRNFSPLDANQALSSYMENFKEARFYTSEEDYLALKEKNGNWRWIRSKRAKTLPSELLMQSHNRKKNYLLDDTSHQEFWKILGIANAQGKIKPDKQSKFRQVNRFIEIIADVIPVFPNNQHLNIVDFGCGKAYLTFALYHYLVNVLKRQVTIVGIDLKQDVVDLLEKMRKELGFSSLNFFVGNIETFILPKEKIDLVVSLHACDTATDHVISRAIQTDVEVILAVPCCQHAFYKKIKQPHLQPLLKHGILKERFAALATDAARAALLEASGYQTQVIEFIETEHTPKNILIKAVKSHLPVSPNAEKDYQDFLVYLGCSLR